MGTFKDTKQDLVAPQRSELEYGIRVPPCDAECFEGDYKSWPTFRDMFQAIYIAHPRLSDVEKLFHLRLKTKKEAHDIVEKFSLTADNFKLAWDALKSQYENKRILINTQLKALFSIPSISTESGSALRKLYRTVCDCLGVLSSYGVKTDNWDPILIFIISQKIPENTLFLFEQSLPKENEIPTWKSLDDFLASRYKILESVEEVKQCPRKSANQSSNLNSKKVNSFHVEQKNFSCKVCNSNHPLRSCKKFLDMDVSSRRKVVQVQKYCYNCLALTHAVYECKSKVSCDKCGRRHHSLLHFSQQKQSSQDTISPPLSQTPLATTPTPIQSTSKIEQQTTLDLEKDINSNSSTLKSFLVNQQKNILLATALVKINVHNQTILLRALIDPGSEATYILQSVVNRFKLFTRATNASICGIGQVQSEFSTSMCPLTLESRINPDVHIPVSAVVLKRLTGNLPSQSVDASNLVELKGLRLADPNFDKPASIDILIGADIYPLILREGVKKEKDFSPIAQNTVFGWVLSGPCERFWELEEVPEIKPFSNEDKFCEKLYTDTTIRNLDGSYTVKLPFKPHLNISDLGLSRSSAVLQFLRQEKRLLCDISLREEYNKVLNEYISLKHMTLRLKGELNLSTQHFYLPHHAVVKPDSASTKVRVVFNASASTNKGHSLNDFLCTGPALQNDLQTILLKWRQYPYVFNSDIEKMYRQIHVHPDHHRFQRIIFRSSNSESDLADFEINRVTFGVNCAPYLAIRTLHQLASDEGNQYPLAKDMVLSDFYVDDVFSGGFDLDTVVQAQTHLNALLLSGGFCLKKWTANHPRLLENIPRGDILDQHFLMFDENSHSKVLGIGWNAREDCFYIRCNLFSSTTVLTKRELFSNIAKIYDPIGWLAPTTILLKILLQDVWKDKTEWDAPIKSTRLETWKDFVKSFPIIKDIKIPRWINYTPDMCVEIHGFCDASLSAYAAAVYSRISDSSGNVFINLLCSKTKVAPLKAISIPRLELCGAVLLTRLVNAVQSSLRLKNYHVYLWTDSMIVLYWIRDCPSRLETFVRNRVSKVQTESPPGCIWKHVPSEHNPADIASRGVMPQNLINNDQWWHGPSWLKNSQETWPITKIQKDPNWNLEIKQIKSFVVNQNTNDDILRRFSCYSRAIKVISYLFRFINLAYRKRKRFYPFRYFSIKLTHHELTFVKTRLVVLAQRFYFSEEFNALYNSKPLSKNSTILSLNPTLDSDLIMRVNGRLTNANLSYNEKYPIILPYSCPLSKLLVGFFHKISLHGGNQQVMYLMRKSFWIPKLKNLIKSFTNSCIVCVLHKKELQTQIMGTLPPESVNYSFPFTHVGLDFAGPFELKVQKGRFYQAVKGYACLFICLCTKAVHLEAVGSLSTESFLAALDRFVGRRGVPQQLFSDNGTNFVAANKILKKELKKAVSEATLEAEKLYLPKNLKWNFIPPGSPHMGGLWEAGIKSFKTHFKKVVGNSRLTFEEFSTLLVKIESCMNSRPISPISENPSDPLPLTPGHFLKGAPLLSLPESQVGEIAKLRNWERVQQILYSFSKRWKEEYLTDLQRRTKWKFPKRNIKVRDVVVVRNENLPPTQWRLGKIEAVHPGKDGKVRVATVKTQQGETLRPIVKLCLLPVDQEMFQVYLASQNKY
ncbi:uncharacterized protein LOC129945022 [Eupeodes corollae]|uniref:uncharacterized protein LOC129945022 n=1 Tax=Eupeodes corollae TaxID=290404 RepID=UPI00249123BE|nr:uncharacterized protein LOC129945022 [Eupeodes corollae]